MKKTLDRLQNLGFKIIRITVILMVLPIISPAEAAMEQEYLRLKQLRETNPQAYQREINAIKDRVRAGLAQAKSGGDESFQQFIKQRALQRRERLEQIRKENPEQFKEILERRKERIENFREHHPEDFKRFLENHPQAALRFEKLKNKNADVQKPNAQQPGSFQDVRRVSPEKNQMPRGGSLPPERAQGKPTDSLKGSQNSQGRPFFKPMRDRWTKSPENRKAPVLSGQNKTRQPAMNRLPESQEKPKNERPPREGPVRTRPRPRQ